jgi:hypothetical protein
MTNAKARIVGAAVSAACWIFLWVLAQSVPLQAAQCCEYCDNYLSACSATCEATCYDNEQCENTCWSECNDMYYSCATFPPCVWCGSLNYPNQCGWRALQYTMPQACPPPIPDNIIGYFCYSSVFDCW